MASSTRGNSPRIPEDFPCKKEKDQSMKCLEKNNYDYAECNTAFENFKFCLGFWDQVKKVRRQHQIKPEMPSPEERAEIYKHFRETGNIPDYSQQRAKVPDNS